jgi:hypothetical protein
MHDTIESAVEILAGTVPRQLNIKLDNKDKAILKSISNQISKNLALTDRQAEMLLRKIQRYQSALEINGVNVNEILEKKMTRQPLRIIDRTQTIALITDREKNQEQIVVTHQKTKKFDDLWSGTRKKIQGRTTETFSQKIFPLNENNLVAVLDMMTFLDFEVGEEITEYLEKIEKIHDTPEKYQPCLEIVDGVLEIKNLSAAVSEKILENYKNLEKEDFLSFLSLLKNHKISLKSPKILEKIKNIYPDENTDLAEKIIFSKSSRLRISPEHHDLEKIVETLILLKSHPILVILEENEHILTQMKILVENFKKFFSEREMTVFFRLPSSEKHSLEFSKFVKEQKLNNFIDEKIKVVFISKQRIPKPLMTAAWKPNTALMLARNDFGKVSIYLNDFANVYYYNDSLSLRKIGERRWVEIDQL